MLGGHGITAAALNTLRASLPDTVVALNATPGAPQLPAVDPALIVPYGLAVKPMGPTLVEVSAPATMGDQPNIPTADADARALVSVVVTITQQQDAAAMSDLLHRYGSAVLAILAAPDACGLGTSMRRWTLRVAGADIDPDAKGRTPRSRAYIGVEVGWVEVLSVGG